LLQIFQSVDLGFRAWGQCSNSDITSSTYLTTNNIHQALLLTFIGSKHCKQLIKYPLLYALFLLSSFLEKYYVQNYNALWSELRHLFQVSQGPWQN